MFPCARSCIVNLIPQAHPIISCYILKSSGYLNVLLFPNRKYWVWRRGPHWLGQMCLSPLAHCVAVWRVVGNHSSVLCCSPFLAVSLGCAVLCPCSFWCASNEGELLQEESLPSVLRKGGIIVLNYFLAGIEWRDKRQTGCVWGGSVGKDL